MEFQTPKDLEDLIRRKPLRVIDIKEMLQKAFYIELSGLYEGEGELRIYRSGNFVMSISAFQDREEQKMTMVHEFGHLYYTPEYDGQEEWIEEPIEREAQRFCKENPEFVEEIFSKYVLNRTAQ